jgi:hypothetical protein
MMIEIQKRRFSPVASFMGYPFLQEPMQQALGILAGAQ